MNGGNKSIVAKRYVHGIIQIQVREQVLPIVGGLAKPERQVFAPLTFQQKPLPTVSFLFSRKTYRTLGKALPLEMFMGL